MKRVSFAVFAIFLILALGCDKEPEPVADFMQCKIEGVSWSALKALTGEMNSGTIIVNGVNMQNDTLRMLIQDQQPGTYPIKNIQNITIYKTGGQTYIPLNSAEGFLTIQQHDTTNKLIEGSFYLTVDGGNGDWKVITDGSFKTSYQ